MKKLLSLALLLLCLMPVGAQDSNLIVVTTTSIIADVARNVGGDFVTVTSIVPVDTDIHAFQVSPQDVRLVEEADLLLVNGIGLEEFLGGLVENVQTPYETVSNGIAVLAFGGHDDHDEEGDHHDEEATETPSMGDMGDMAMMSAMTGGYATFQNTTDSAIVVSLVAGNSFNVGELHETVVTDGVARMIHLEEGLIVPANSTIELKPGGLHMMFLDVTQTISTDSPLAFNVVLSDGREVPVEAAVSMTPIEGNRFEGEGLVITNLWVRPVEVAGMPMDMEMGDHDAEATAEATDHMDMMPEGAKGHMHDGGQYLGYYNVDAECGDLLEEHHEEGEAHEEGEEHSHGACDPHVWTDPRNVMVWADNIAEIFATYDPANAEAYKANAEAYKAELDALNEEVEALFSAIPAEKRVIVTNHEFLAYFSAHYGFELAGVVISGGTTLAELSPQEIAGLVEVIRAEGVTAIFAEVSNISRLADVVAQEVGESVSIVTLYSDSLSTDENANTYIGYLRSNATRIAEALSQ